MYIRGGRRRLGGKRERISHLRIHFSLKNRPGFNWWHIERGEREIAREKRGRRIAENQMIFLLNNCTSVLVCKRGWVYLQSCLSLSAPSIHLVYKVYTLYAYMSYECDTTDWHSSVNTCLMRVRAGACLSPPPPFWCCLSRGSNI